MSQLVSIALGVALLAAQQPVFRSGVQVVEVDARVFDRDGRFVTTLTRDDFEVLEDGVPQTIVAMTLVGGENERTIPTPPTSPPSTSTTPSTPTHVPTTWIFFFDLNHLSAGGGFSRAREAVEEFIAKRFREGDLAGVIAGDKMVNGRLTTLRAELAQAVRSVKPSGEQRNLLMELTREWPRFRDAEEALDVARNISRAVSSAVARACSDDPTACITADAAVRGKAQRMATLIHRSTLETFNALHGLAAGLAKMTGPKTVVFLSDGFVTHGLDTTLRTVVGQTGRAGARVYAIDVRGLNRGSQSSMLDRAASDDPAGGGPQFDAQEDGVNSLAVDTGGMMIRNENNIGRALDTIAADTGTYYVLAYQPTNTSFDGKYRKIEIRVKQDGLKVRARQGYLALEPSKMLVPRPIKAPEPAAATPSAAMASEPKATRADVPTLAPSTVPTPPPSTEPTKPTETHVPTTDNVLKLRGSSSAPASDAARRGWAAYERGDLEAALPLLEQAAGAPDARPWSLYALGFTYGGLNRAADAITAWERVRAAAPDFAPVYLDLAAHYAQADDISRALATLREAERRWPANIDVLNGIGVLLAKRSAFGDAIASFAKAVQAAPDDPLSWLNLGRTYELRYDRARRYDEMLLKWVGPEGDRMKARESYERCVKLGGPYATQAAEALARMAGS